MDSIQFSYNEPHWSMILIGWATKMVEATFTKGLNLDLGLKWRLLSLIHAESVVLDLAYFTMQQNRNFGPVFGLQIFAIWGGLNFVNKDLNMAAINFPPLQNLKWFQLLNKVQIYTTPP